VNWAELRSLRTAQPLAVWLAAIQEQYGFAVVRDGAFLRLRNRRWWYDRGREIPQSLLTRWAQLSAGMPEDRLQAAVEIAEWAPLNAGSLPPYYLRLGRLADTPEIKELSTEATDPGEAEVAPGFTQVVIDAQTELRIYARLTARQQQTVRGEGLTLSWQEMPSQARDLFAHRIRTFWEPGIDAGHLRQSSLWMQFQNDEIVFRYGISGVPHDRAFKFAAGQGYIHRFVPAHPARGNALVGSPAPELLYEDASGKRISLQPHGPLLVYVAPAWPRPAVARQEDFADLKALQQTSAPAAGTEARVLVLGADATAAELRGWWKVRGFDLPPLAITIDTARRLGVRGQPVAFIVDRGGRVAWVKEGYTPGDEAVWRRELARVGDVPGD
jgi:hypothetical protein